MSKTRKKYIIYTIIIVIIILIDQISKILVKNNMNLGDEFNVFGEWFKIHFVENEGIAFGFKFGFEYAKLILSIIRIIMLVFIAYYLNKLILNENTNYKSLLPFTLIFSGALGNIIDSVFYGVIFGYNTWLYGNVVDMLFFPLFDFNFPEWFPFVGGNYFLFFSPVFNIADSCLTIGMTLILIFRKENQLNIFINKELKKENLEII